jgi:glucose/mannose transport system substrate-binding protein
MKFSMGTTACAAVLTLMSASAHAADAPTAEVMHWWVSAGESAAVKQIANAYDAAGGVWKDNAIAGGEVAIPAIISRITGGNPPTAAQMPLGKQLDDLVAQGLLAPLDDYAKETDFLNNIPEVFKKAVVYPDGHMYALPINDHGHNWVWYNKQVLADAGAKEPVTWDDMFAALDALKAKGNVVPLAVGAQPWQLGQTFFSVLLTKEGSDLYFKLFRDLDVDAVNTPEFKDAVATFLKLRDYSDPGAANREWNVAANMVITGKAGFQFMGDWAKGEYLAAGQTPGKEFGCQILGNGDGKQLFTVSSDAFIFPVNKAPGQADAQKLLAETMMSKDVQIAFNSKKGSVPARLDVDTSKLDACAQLGVKILQDPDQRIPSTDFLVSPDMIGAERDLAGQAWADPNYTVDQFVAAFAKIIEAEKSSR